MLIKLENIYDWAGENYCQRKFVEGERLLTANHLIKCGKNLSKGSDSNLVHLTAMCLQTSSLKEKPHEINIVIEKNGKIINVKCSCKAGLSGNCKHCLCSLLYIYKSESLDNLSSTDTKCWWKKDQKKVLVNYEPAPLMDHPCTKTQLNKVLENTPDVAVLTEEDEIKIHEMIVERLPSSAITKHMLGRHSPVTFIEPSKVSEEEKNAIEKIFLLQDSDIMEELKNYKVCELDSCCLEVMTSLLGNAFQTCVNTKEFYDCWLRERRYRITGSICYGVFTYSKNANPNWQKKSKEIFDPCDFKSCYTEYGKKTEDEARQKFIEKTNFKVFSVGLVVSILNPWIGYSPDGVIFFNGVPFAILEIKCPFIGKTKGIKETVDSVLKKYLQKDGDKLTLKKKHKYYGQVQLGMAVLNVKFAYFAIYSSFDQQFEILIVSEDKNFIIEMLQALKIAYYKHILHNACLDKEKMNQ